MSVLAFALIIAAVGCLALAMPKHYSEIIGSTVSKPVALGLRIAGCVLLATAVAPLVAIWGLAIGVVAWFALAAAAVLVVAALLTYAPKLFASKRA